MIKNDKDIKDIVKQAIDLHVHVGPEVMPRKYTLPQLVKSEAGKMAGVAIKSHFFPTTPFIKEIPSIQKNFKVVGSITLNNSVGGLNVEAIRATAALSKNPVIVWMPTTSAKNYLDKSEYEIRPEWVKGTSFKPRESKEVAGITITKNNKLTPDSQKVLDVVKEMDLILATGHVSWEEAKKLVIDASQKRIKRIILTHPIYQLIDMPVTVQRELATLGAMVEICYSMYSIDKIKLEKIVAQIKSVGPQYFIISSDVGQPASPSPSEALFEFAELLFKNGIKDGDLHQMLVINPRKLIS